MKKTVAIFAALLGLTLLISFEASAQSVRGFIRATTDEGTFLDVTADQAPFLLVANRPALETDLKNLKVGDYLVARGTLDVMSGEAHIDSIETVGLRELIGPWQSGASRIYEFEDFSRLNLYKALRDPQGVVLAKLKEMNYSVAPESKGRYSIFMSDNRSVQVGLLEFEARGIKLSVIDPKTGRVSENISLSPLPVK